MEYIMKHFQTGMYKLLDQINATTVIDLSSNAIATATNLTADLDVLTNRVDSIMRQIDLFFLPVVLIIFIFCIIMSVAFIVIAASIIKISRSMSPQVSTELQSVRSESSFNSDLKNAVNRRALYIDAYSTDSKTKLFV